MCLYLRKYGKSSSRNSACGVPMQIGLPIESRTDYGGLEFPFKTDPVFSFQVFSGQESRSEESNRPTAQ
ncbi:hypothetical protein EVAR_40796_1 [Eumeta japonica]|uniref:Uncharacterized protein n=1 Tax=Eumeta variegata TaxID=151549 RepID=A0A4C1X6P7_EUMVA|nr:hypothetical protein EVAR_40796_1 [Eumeta japonica]